MADVKSCWPFWHNWTTYGQTQVVTAGGGLPQVAQRRVCRRCNAVDYRRVGLHNG